jgi:hypothetical protein
VTSHHFDPYDPTTTLAYAAAPRINQTMKYLVSLTCIFFALNAGAEEIPFPSALDAAAVVESRISDLKREALVLGNGDLNALLWERDGALCLRFPI